MKVAPVDVYENEVLAEIEALSLKCADGVDFLLEELETQDPDLAERCGLLADRHEVYGIAIPKCTAKRMIVSIDTRKAGRPRTVHGIVGSTRRYCDEGRKMATAQFGLVNPAWEAA